MKRKALILLFSLLSLSSCEFVIFPSDFNYSEQEKVDLKEIYDDLVKDIDVDNVTSNICLSSDIEGLQIITKSDKPNVIGHDGTLYISKKDQYVQFTITLKYNNEEYSEILSLHVNKTSVNNLFIKDVLLSKNIGLYFEVFGVITGVLSDSYFYIEDYSGSILVHYDTDSFDPVAQKGNNVSLIGKLSHDGNNFSLTEVKLVNLVSKDNFVRTNQVEINDLSKYLYKKVSINDMKVISIETNKDTIITLYKDGIYVDLVIDDIFI